MTIQDPLDGVDQRPHSDDNTDLSEVIESTLLDMDPDEVARQLPHLVETVVAESRFSEDTEKFVIGVSLSRNHTLLDYRLERVVVDDAYDSPWLETLKPAVSTSHEYLTFTYPPDPNFDAAALRGALLAVFEHERTRSPFTRSPSESKDDGETETSGRLSNLLSQLVGN